MEFCGIKIYVVPVLNYLERVSICKVDGTNNMSGICKYVRNPNNRD